MADPADEFFTGLDDAEEGERPEPVVEAAPEPEVAKVEPVVEAAKPEPKAEPKPDAPNPRDFVPVAAHLEEKSERKRLQQETAQLRAEIEALKNPPKAKPEAPVFEQDPKGYVDHSVQSALDKLETGLKPVTQSAQQAEAVASETRFHQALTSTEQSFLSQQPDYYEALGHLRQIRASELMTLNPELTQAQVGDVMRREELQLASHLMRAGRNPSEVAYSLARARGYAPKEAKANVTQLLPKVDEEKRLPPDQTLGSGTGSPMVGENELQDDDVFDAAMKEMFGRKSA